MRITSQTSSLFIPLFRLQNRFISKKKKRIQDFQVLWPIATVDAPPQLRPHEIQHVNRLFAVPSKLIISSNDPMDLPDWKIPEVAIAGRSNVGKSTLINGLMQQKDLVRTSKTPGRTQQLHFLSVGGKTGSLPAMSIVDMPGYGYANAPKAVVDTFYNLVGGYIEKRNGNNLRNVYLLIDARRGIQAVDEEFMDFLYQRSMIFQVILTKADTVPLDELKLTIKKAQDIAMRNDRINMNPIIHVVSTKQNFGIVELRRQMVAMSGLLPPIKQAKSDK